MASKQQWLPQDGEQNLILFAFSRRKPFGRSPLNSEEMTVIQSKAPREG